MISSVSAKPHVVFVPFPFQGHITPQMKLAQLFNQSGFHITFINTEFNQDRFLSSNANSLPDLPDFDFATFHDGLDKDAPRWIDLCFSSRENFFGPLMDLITRIDESENSPPVTCIIADAMMPFTVKIAQRLGVPCMLLFVGSAAAFTVFKNYNILRERGFVPITDVTSNDKIDFIPGLSNVLGKDLPFMAEYVRDFPMKELEEAFEGSGIIFNTFESLEEDVLSAIRAMFPHIYTVGPLEMLRNLISNQKIRSLQCNLREEQHGCLEWLDLMKPNSVLYVSFGSISRISEGKLIELAWGILNSNIPFLWVMTPSTILPPDLLNMVREKGYVASWSPQELVLNHPSIGGFITHSGWNSTLESLCAGVPMICWPQFGDHPVISRYCCSNWGIGIEMDANVKRDEVVSLVRDLMEGDRGMELKKKSMEWKKLAQEATNQVGSSFVSWEKLLKEARNGRE